MLTTYGQRRGSKKEYKEDLSKVQPTYTAALDSMLTEQDSTPNRMTETKYDITNELNIVLDSISSLNKNIKFIKGYKVLAYSGSSQEEALEVRKLILEAFEQVEDFKDEKTEFVWHQPTFRVYVGEYLDRLPAVRMAEFLKEREFEFEDEEMTINPLVVPDKLKIRE